MPRYLKQNGENAKNIIRGLTLNSKISEKDFTNIYLAIELAAKPNWFYPSKGEICDEIDKRILIIHIDNNKTNYITFVTTVQNVSHHYKTLLYDAEADDYYSWDDIKAWTNLPQL